MSSKRCWGDQATFPVDTRLESSTLKLHLGAMLCQESSMCAHECTGDLKSRGSLGHHKLTRTSSGFRTDLPHRALCTPYRTIMQSRMFWLRLSSHSGSGFPYISDLHLPIRPRCPLPLYASDSRSSTQTESCSILPSLKLSNPSSRTDEEKLPQ